MSETALLRWQFNRFLFVGSGLSQRYFRGPSWESLLSELKKKCPVLEKEFAYYKQTHWNLIDIGSVFSDAFREWAWDKGRKHFPAELFAASNPPSIYLKYAVSDYLKKLLPDGSWKPPKNHAKEVDALKAIRPHALITTNYDRLLEEIFPDYEPIIGQQVIHANYSSIGEILKIHGCVTNPISLVLNRADYDEFDAKKKYLSAKLLTFFSEHPLIFLGYSASDPNVQAILADINEILSPEGALIPNIYLVEWIEDAESRSSLPREAVISVGKDKAIRVKRICASSFEWVFDCFKVDGILEAVNPKLLRALLARTFKLVRHDIPTRTIEIDYATLKHAIEHDGELAKLYGITTLDNPSAVNAIYPFSLTQVANELGYSQWHKANKLIEAIKDVKGIDIKASDNRYHVAIMAGNVMQTHKYSQEFVDLLRKVENGEEYTIEA